MKKIYYYAMAFLLFLTVSCVSEKIESDEDRTSYNKEAVWEYNGDNTTLNKVIEELKSGPEREKLERRLLKNDVLWEEAKFLLIDNKRRILVPFLSTDRENVLGVLSLVKDIYGKTTFDMTVRSQLMIKNNKLPFWDSGIWLGYFMALDKDILGIKNGNPGIGTRPVQDNLKRANAKTMGQECKIIEEEIIFYQYYYVIDSTGEISEYGYTITHTESVFKTVCYWVPDPPTPITEPNTGNDVGSDSGGGGINYSVLIVKNIIDQKLNPCPKGVLDKLKNNTNCDIKNVLDKLGANTTYLLNIESGYAGGKPGNTIRNSKFNYTTTISQDFTSSTSLFRASIILHEVVHAFFMSLRDEQINGAGATAFVEFPTLFQAFCDTKYPPNSNDRADAHHEEMANSYVNAIGAALQEFQTGIAPAYGTRPDQIYTDLAWGGLKDAPIFDKKFPLGSPERKRIENRYSCESNGSTVEAGTPNQQIAIGKQCTN